MKLQVVGGALKAVRSSWLTSCRSPFRRPSFWTTTTATLSSSSGGKNKDMTDAGSISNSTSSAISSVSTSPRVDVYIGSIAPILQSYNSTTSTSSLTLPSLDDVLACLGKANTARIKRKSRVEDQWGSAIGGVLALMGKYHNMHHQRQYPQEALENNKSLVREVNAWSSSSSSSPPPDQFLHFNIWPASWEWTRTSPTSKPLIVTRMLSHEEEKLTSQHTENKVEKPQRDTSPPPQKSETLGKYEEASTTSLFHEGDVSVSHEGSLVGCAAVSAAGAGIGLDILTVSRALTLVKSDIESAAMKAILRRFSPHVAERIVKSILFANGSSSNSSDSSDSCSTAAIASNQSSSSSLSSPSLLFATHWTLLEAIAKARGVSLYSERVIQDIASAKEKTELSSILPLNAPPSVVWKVDLNQLLLLLLVAKSSASVSTKNNLVTTTTSSTISTSAASPSFPTSTTTTPPSVEASEIGTMWSNPSLPKLLAVHEGADWCGYTYELRDASGVDSNKQFEPAVMTVVVIRGSKAT